MLLSVGAIGIPVKNMSPYETASSITQCNCNALRKAARRITKHYDRCLEPSGLRATQYIILALLAERPELMVSELAEALDLDRTTAGKNIRPLERNGLVDVTSDELDGRSRKVSLTVAGRTALGVAMPLWKSAQKEFETGLGKDRTSNLRQTLKLIDVWGA